jgi:hypothetical protein
MALANPIGFKFLALVKESFNFEYFSCISFSFALMALTESSPF